MKSMMTNASRIFTLNVKKLVLFTIDIVCVYST